MAPGILTLDKMDVRGQVHAQATLPLAREPLTQVQFHSSEFSAEDSHGKFSVECS
jgi:hypothetical protein